MHPPQVPRSIPHCIHEIHKQLEIISGCAHLIDLSNQLSEKERRDLQHIHEAVHVITGLTREMHNQSLSRGR